ncbi:phosphate-repressible phosphate permease [Aspergillus arachidicola]|uniref:Phosphate transporter n=1 Tax=Aspergillus arachidicola TaxID=656916 RepID=A0A2G7G3C0_9EURO|nr:phosphate-repressible phosphate permease [Aspergillus arachidicola]
MIPAITARYDWILAITSIAFVFSAFGNGANDVANSYATSVAARTLEMWQAGILATITEFVGAVALGSRVTSTIKSGIISPDRFMGKPGTFMLAMGCAEVGSAAWLMVATHFGWPVSTTQTVVGALVGVGFATQAEISWGWKSGSVSQIAASWGIAPAVACGFSAIIFGTLKYSVLERKDSFKWGMRLIPLYLSLTGAILALFIVVEAPTAPSLEEFGAGKAVGIILGVFFGCLLISYVFFVPYFHRRLVKQDPRIRAWHIPLGPWLLKDDCPIYWPGKGDSFVTNYYEDAHGEVRAGQKDTEKATDQKDTNISDVERTAESAMATPQIQPKKAIIGPHERFLQPVEHLTWFHPAKYWGWVKFILLQGVTRDVITHDSEHLRAVHAPSLDLLPSCLCHDDVYRTRLERVANAVGPWAGSYATYLSGEVNTKSETPVWFLVIAGLLLGAGFWFYGYNVMRSMGNKITQMSPTRGFATELGAAVTVLLASRLGLPVSTTQCLVGAATGVALMNFDTGAMNWRQLGFIFMGWVLTLPSAGLVAGLICLMALNAPHF